MIATIVSNLQIRKLSKRAKGTELNLREAHPEEVGRSDSPLKRGSPGRCDMITQGQGGRGCFQGQKGYFFQIEP